MAKFAGRYDENLLSRRDDDIVKAVTSASVRVLETGTSTETTLYTDRTKSTTVAQPISPDSNGNLEFFANPGTYDVEISVDGTVRSTNTVVVHPDGIEALNTVDAVFNVKNYGAVGDGTTDDAASIQSAIDAADAAGGGTVYFPHGDYLVQSALSVSERITLAGSGYAEVTDVGAARIIKDGAFDLITITFPAVVIRDLVIDGAAGNTGGGIVVKGSRCTIDRVTVTDQGGVGIRIGGTTDNANLWRLIHVTARGNGSHGVYIHDASGVADTNGGYAENLDLQSNTGDGLRVGACEVSTFSGLVAQTNGGYGIFCTTGCKNNTFLNPHSEFNTTDNFTFDVGVSNNLVTGSMNYVPTDNGNNTVVRATGGTSQKLNVTPHLTVGIPTLKRSLAATIGLGGNTVGYYLDERDAAADNRLWALIVSGGQMHFEVLSDDEATVTRPITIIRSGTAASMKLGNSGGELGFFGATPVAKPSAYSTTNVVADRSYDANATTTDELADVLGTLIADLQSLGLIG